ncbi:MAG: NAD(+) diphosphatase [Paracoccaceae bacterium]
MKTLEAVTFGGGGLDRAAGLRGEPEKMAALQMDGRTRAIAIWQGRVLLAGDDLARLPVGHKIFQDAPMPPVFLGCIHSEPFFAYDMSSWQPDTPPAVDSSIFEMSEISHPDLPADHRFVDLRHVMAQLSPLDAELAASAKALFAWHDSHGYCAKCGQASQVTLAGWQRQCPACQAAHFPRTDPVVIMLITHGNNVLLGRSPGWPDGMFSLLAGFVEPGETLEAAVRREVHEEVGIKVGAVSYLASQPWPFPASLMLGCRGQALGTELSIDPVEIEQALWLSREDLMAVFAGQNPDITPAPPGSIAHYLLQNWLADRLD